MVWPRATSDGYLETLPPPGQDKLIDADASHAWFAVYHPGLGWFAFDPTSNHCPDNRHLTVAWRRDYGDVTPPRRGLRRGLINQPCPERPLPEYELDQRVRW